MIMSEETPALPAAPRGEGEPASHDDQQLARTYLSVLRNSLELGNAVPALQRRVAEAYFADSRLTDIEEEEYALLVLAIRTDPGHAEALLNLKDFFDLTLEEDVAATRMIVDLADRRLTATARKALNRRFWDTLDSRACLLARDELALLLDESGRTDEALAEWETILRLNALDHQGVRYNLLPHYLKRGQPLSALELYVRFPDESQHNTLFAWGAVACRLLCDDPSGAAEALALAREQNGYTEAYLRGHRKPGKEPPKRFPPGSREEAERYAPELLEIWAAHPPFAAWLAAQPKPRH